MLSDLGEVCDPQSPRSASAEGMRGSVGQAVVRNKENGVSHQEECRVEV